MATTTTPRPHPRFEVLRDALDAIDDQIVKLLSDRQAVVAEIGELKNEHRIRVFHPAREANIILRRRAQARKRGLDPDFVEGVVRALLRQSRMLQYTARHRPVRGTPATVLLVGGRGGMGSLLRKWFAESGHAVRILDRRDWRRVRELCRGIDLAILTVPIEKTEEVATRIGPYLPRACVLADITSVKERPLAAMLRAHKGPVLGLHPMFGPGTQSLDRQVLAVIPARGKAQSQWVVDQFAEWGAVIVPAQAREHDELMAFVQALNHFSAFVFGQFLARRGPRFAKLMAFASPVYRLEMIMIARLFAQNPRLYAGIILADKPRRRLLTEFLTSASANKGLLRAGDKKAFAQEFRRVARYFRDFSEQAMRESGHLIEKMTEQFQAR
jgi:chorismate mutase/prephenate dehydrogenase